MRPGSVFVAITSTSSWKRSTWPEAGVQRVCFTRLVWVTDWPDALRVV